MILNVKSKTPEITLMIEVSIPPEAMVLDIADAIFATTNSTNSQKIKSERND
jgi:hypothetical protein